MTSSGVVTSAYESVVKELAEVRPPIENLDEKFFECGGPKPGSLIEISGQPNTGKTMLLAHIMSRCLPPTYFGGKYSDIVFVNMGHKFSIIRFREYLRRIIFESGEKCTTEECETVLESCLESVTVLDCFSAIEFELLFEAVEDILLKNRYINLVAIDNIDAFYWEDSHQKLVRMSTHLRKTTSRLRTLCKSHNICCVYTLDSNYLQCKKSCNVSNTFSTRKPEYVFDLKLLKDGTRTLNNRAITISKDGMHFL